LCAAQDFIEGGIEMAAQAPIVEGGQQKANPRRGYNREYMRQWRAHPGNAEREKANRARYDFERKQRFAKEQPDPSYQCEFCQQRLAVRTVRRLVSLPGGYEEVERRTCEDCDAEFAEEQKLPLEETTSLGLASILGFLIKGERSMFLRGSMRSI
jgi:hypothetical protein